MLIDAPGRSHYHNVMPTCANCGASYEATVYRTTLCENCGKELKTCRNCRHYSPGASNDCHEPVSDLVSEKDRANFCDWFTPAADAGAGKDSEGSAGNSRKAFDALFGDD